MYNMINENQDDKVVIDMMNPPQPPNPLDEFEDEDDNDFLNEPEPEEELQVAPVRLPDSGQTLEEETRWEGEKVFTETVRVAPEVREHQVATRTRSTFGLAVWRGQLEYRAKIMLAW